MMWQPKLVHHWLPGFTLALVLLIGTANLWAQATGTMSGFVKDASGAFVPQASVTATLVSRQARFNAQTNSGGFYNLPALQPGTYMLTVEKQGFTTFVQTGLILTVGQHLRVDATLRLGAITQRVSVSGRAALVDTSSGTVSGLVDDRRIVDLPLNGRNVMSLAGIVPGVLNVTAPESLNDTRSGPIMNVNGGRGNMNNFTFDGAYFINASRNTGMNYPPPDAVQEFRIQTSDFDAQYGHNGGSQISVVSKAGTNAFHGDVWEFLRNEAFNARNFFAPTVPADKENQFGGTIGGPILKDKLFFFGGFQGLLKRPEGVTNQATVPTAAERNGDFTALLPGTPLVDPTNILTGAPLTTASGAPCVTNNIVAASCISPVAKNLLQDVPITPTGTLVTLALQPVNDYTYFGRIDANITPKNVLFGHVYVDHNTYSDPTAGGNITSFVHFRSGAESDMVTLNDTDTISPGLVNQAIASFLRTSTVQSNYPYISNATLGLNLPQYASLGSINVNVGNELLFGSNGTSITEYIGNSYEFRDAMTWMKGRHTLQFGGEVLPMHFLQRFLPPPSFSFSGSRSGSPFSDFLLGAYTSMGLEFGVAQNDDLTAEPSFFFQDEFKARPRLTLTYGLRWEPDPLWHDKYNHVDTFKLGEQSTVVPDAPPGILFPGDAGIARSIAPADLNNLAPRFGFAWDVFGDGRTSVRGGYGVFFNHLNADTMAQQNAPFTGNITEFNGLLSDPFGSVGVTPPPVVPSGKFGCVKISAFPGVNCPLFPLPSLGYYVDTGLQTPYIQDWNLDIQRQLTPSTMLEASYVGNVGIKLNNLRDFNPARFEPGTTYDASTGQETTISSLENVNNRALYEPGIVAPNAWVLGNDFRSWYHSLQVQMIHRLSNGLSVNASYTLSKAIDMCSFICEAGGLDPNPLNLRSMRGRADWDRRNAFVASYLWSPSVHFSDHWKNVLLGGWTVSGITSVQSGPPISFFSPIDVAVNGTGASEHAFLTGKAIPLSHPNRGAMVNEFFNTAAFASPICTFTPQPGNPQVIQQENCTPDGIRYNLLGQYGQSGRNILSGPAYSDTDFTIMRAFTLKERYRAEVRGDFFNIFNQVNFTSPADYSNSNNTVTDSGFGQLLGANPARVVQVSVKFFW
jgi:hypothetical protein